MIRHVHWAWEEKEVFFKHCFPCMGCQHGQGLFGSNHGSVNTLEFNKKLLQRIRANTEAFQGVRRNVELEAATKKPKGVWTPWLIRPCSPVGFNRAWYEFSSHTISVWKGFKRVGGGPVLDIWTFCSSKMEQKENAAPALPPTPNTHFCHWHLPCKNQVSTKGAGLQVVPCCWSTKTK